MGNIVYFQGFVFAQDLMGNIILFDFSIGQIRQLPVLQNVKQSAQVQMVHEDQRRRGASFQDKYFFEQRVGQILIRLDVLIQSRLIKPIFKRRVMVVSESVDLDRVFTKITSMSVILNILFILTLMVIIRIFRLIPHHVVVINLRIVFSVESIQNFRRYSLFAKLLSFKDPGFDVYLIGKRRNHWELHSHNLIAISDGQHEAVFIIFEDRASPYFFNLCKPD